jgi:hypothetical protein
MNMIKKFTFVTLLALAATLVFHSSIAQAGDQGSRGDNNEKGDHGQPISNPFAILLDGVYKPVAKGAGPKDNLGLTQVDLSDGTFSKVRILPVAGLPGDDEENGAIGTFYVRIGGGVCAYDLPGGALYARFTGSDAERRDDPDGSWTLDGTFKLNILETTGVYQPFAGGHIHMVDILKWRAGKQNLLEFCYCHFHRNLFTP